MYTGILNPAAHLRSPARAPRQFGSHARSLFLNSSHSRLPASRLAALIPCPGSTRQATMSILSCTPSVLSCYLLASRPNTPLRTSTPKPKGWNYLRRASWTENPICLALAAASRDVTKRNTLRGVSLRSHKAPLPQCRLARCASHPCGPPGRCRRAPTSTRTSQYVRSCDHSIGAKTLPPLALAATLRDAQNETIRLLLRINGGWHHLAPERRPLGPTFPPAACRTPRPLPPAPS